MSSFGLFQRHWKTKHLLIYSTRFYCNFSSISFTFSSYLSAATFAFQQSETIMCTFDSKLSVIKKMFFVFYLSLFFWLFLFSKELKRKRYLLVLLRFYRLFRLHTQSVSVFLCATGSKYWNRRVKNEQFPTRLESSYRTGKKIIARCFFCTIFICFYCPSTRSLFHYSLPFFSSCHYTKTVIHTLLVLK